MGIIITFLLILYIVVAYFLSKLIFKIFKKKLISRLFLTFCLVFPFWDIFLQEGTAIYYQLVYPEYKVYEKAKLDKDGKVDSIAYILYGYPLKSYTREKLDKYYEDEFNLVNNFLEFYVKDEKGNYKILKIKKLSQGNYEFNLSDKSTARYKIITEDKLTTFYYKFGSLKIVDTNKKKPMIESYYVYFNKFGNYFRTNILQMVGGTGHSLHSLPNIGHNAKETLLETIGIKDKK